MRRLIPATTLGLYLLLAGCGSAGNPAPAPIPEISFAPQLGVNVASMERTPEGVYYRDLVVGNGPPARSGQTVALRYAGWLPDGTQIDAVVSRDAPFEFRLGDRSIIRGWTEGIIGMREGGQRLMVLPPELGYGRRSHGAVPANSVLVFLVELVGVR